MNEELKAGDILLLKVVDVKEFGAFLDGGLERDILLPEKEIEGVISRGEMIPVALKENLRDQSLFATMRLYEFLGVDSPYKKNDMATGTVYKINENLGVFVAVDNKYHGLILNKELYGEFAVGDSIEVRIKSVREDGKLELSTRQPAYSEIEKDSENILEYLKINDGEMSLNDNSSPDEIRDVFNISKKAFKRAIGRLLKEGVIEIMDDGIKLSWVEEPKEIEKTEE